MSEISVRQDPSLAPQATPTPFGHVNSVTGSQAVVGILPDALSGPYRDAITVGKFVKIETRKALLVGVITEVSGQNSAAPNEQGLAAIVRVDLLGEIERDAEGKMHFHRGVSDYPTINNSVFPLENQELRVVFESSTHKTIKVGNLHQDKTVDACVEVDEMLSKHFAV